MVTFIIVATDFGMFRVVTAFWLSLLLMVALPGASRAQEKRYALLIANQAYDSSVGALKNPHNDLALVADALVKQGFEVLPLVKDAKRTAILAAVRELTAKLRVAGAGAIGFLYYSGHGAAEKDTGINYLIPVDAKEPGTSAFWDDSIKLDDIMRLLDGARGAVKFVVFDACRNELQLPTRDTSKGLLPVAEQQGFFVAYASAPGRTASDRGETSGPYAAALARELGRRGLDHLNLFQNVKETVIASTSGSQHPWESNGLTRRVYLTGEPTTAADMALWESVRTSNDSASLQRYLERFPEGVYATTARQMIERLKQEDAQKEAARQFEIERKAQEAKQQAELQKALDEARKAREALLASERQRAAADAEAERARAAVATAATERNAAAAREQEMRQAQEKLLSEAVSASDRSAADRTAALADLERRMAAVSAEAKAAREALAAAEARQKQAELAAEDARKVSQTARAAESNTLVAALQPAVIPMDLPQEELTRRLQAELKRVGCYGGEVDGSWGAGSRSGLDVFVRTTGLPIKGGEPSAEILTAVIGQRGRICPLRCGSGEVEQGGRCVAARPAEGEERTRETPAKVVIPPRPSTPAIRADRPDALVYSWTIWPRHSLKVPSSVTANTPFGALACSALQVGKRECRWR